MNQSKKVMIVDDSMIMRHMIKKYISDENVEIVGTAENGKIALDLFKQTNPDIVTLDITMPEMDGLTLLETMMNMNKNVKVMVITALSDKTTGLKAMKMGATSYITKPFSEKSLKEIMNRVVFESAN